ncbi:hypothetical protein TNIN_94281 [Trichonephila inaurata madagascariensis]|uniref:Uncharacterized protein n=1 Tax=Trichonephila inaurata madagascariensis TaxID=2747483 RepID=A0A8X7C729_9ARAC|nr:hypothetical protein TNIN_94281 [Trichonephila inaurata madagascariensis]
MVERLLRTLKQAIRCHIHKMDGVATSGPVGSTSMHQGGHLNASCAEMVFGKTIVLQENSFEPSSQTPTDPREFLLRLRHSGLLNHPLLPAIHLPCFQHSLKTCSHVFVGVED